ncbi:peptide-methionine (R)-S-oxide reductase MsrB [Christiangramia sp. LLG6405-1]|uniref:peptide-methionine (R)-S-oxide reductase MsrB n=1 Tax=Christiangramia sp. LLG6405-1 TaxID=3160832 RepID=UPI00386AE77F
MKKYSIEKTEEEWKQKLTPEQYRVLREKGTEAPHTGEYNLHFEDGEYQCAACGEQLFESDAKFESGCGWPSFDNAIDGKVEYIQDRTFGMIRTEILCSNCGSHLGHVFDDGPTETGQRFCVNSASINFNQ